MRKIAVVTVARSDFGILRPLLEKIEKDADLSLQLMAAGMHLSEDHGMTITEIEEAGFTVSDRIDMSLSMDSPEGIARSIGTGTIRFAESFGKAVPDILIILGDRFEVLAAATAALPFGIPTAHIHGGESTEGLIDEAIRHSITKMSHLHFTSTRVYGERVIQMGEEPWRVMVCGAPGLDNLSNFIPLDRSELEGLLGIPLEPAPLLVTYHPVTLEYGDTEDQIAQLLEGLDEIGMPVVFTYPNADTYGRRISRAINDYTKSHQNSCALPNLGTRAYFSLMSHACAMVGNSSSGIIEAASFQLPVVNIGNRQRGRIRGRNVIDSGYRKEDIVAAVRKAVDNQFRSSLEGMENPYGDGKASGRIVQVLKEVKLDQDLLLKRFYRIEVG